MRILMAEDDAVSRKLISSALTKMGYEVVSACNGLEAWEILQREDIRLVICDWMMPEMDGLELVKRIRARAHSAYVYTILLTSRGGKEDVVSGLSAGADDYVTKPFHRDELLVRLRAGERIVRLEGELAEKNSALERMALVDGLTGVGNRRAFDEAIVRVANQSLRFKHPFSLVVLDLDRFKDFNDMFGHEAGDNCLRTAAQSIAKSVRGSDAAFRYGGEEFAILLPETDTPGALVVAERVRLSLEQAALEHPRNVPFGKVTASLGIATYSGGALDTTALFQEADKALYAAKSQGRNRIVAPALVS